ncbi:hypothetical protein [Ferroacidibacillus organovorans]|nr:hypothetical protein [Ferroacidibacillus organovorans]
MKKKKQSRKLSALLFAGVLAGVLGIAIAPNFMTLPPTSSPPPVLN